MLRIPTGILNDVIGEAQITTPAPSYKGRRLKNPLCHPGFCAATNIYSLCQQHRALAFSYERYLENQLQRRFGFDGTPIRLILKGPRQDK